MFVQKTFNKTAEKKQTPRSYFSLPQDDPQLSKLNATPMNIDQDSDSQFESSQSSDHVSIITVNGGNEIKDKAGQIKESSEMSELKYNKENARHSRFISKHLKAIENLHRNVVNVV